MGEPWQNKIVDHGMIAVADVLFNPDNWRIHPKEQMAALLGTIKDVGFIRSITLNVTTGHLVDGHARVILADREGVTELPAEYIEVSETQEKEILATLDPLAALAATDKEKLDALLRDVSTGDAAVQQMLADMAEREGIVNLPIPGGGGDDFDTTPDEGPTRVQIGDVWLIRGNGLEHRLICGDCTDAAVVERLMKGEKPLLMVTDPPYGVEYDPAWRNEAASAGHLSYAPSRIGEVANDDRADWTEAWGLFGGDVVYCWHADRRASSVQASLEAAGFEMRCQIIWSKSNYPISRGHYHWRHEPCWYAVRKGATASWVGDRKQTTVWEINLDKNVEGGHSTQKPLECMARPIRNHDALLVYDPFLGSGTTIIAGHRLGRKVYGCEIEPKYVDVCLRRAEAEGLTCERESS